MNKRYIGILTLIPFLLLILIGGLPLIISIMVLSLIGLYEFYNAAKNKDINCFYIVGYLLCIIYYCLFIFKINLIVVLMIVSISVILQFCIIIWKPKYNFIDIGVTIFGFIYVAVLFSFIPMINNKSNGYLLLWVVFISSFATDTFAYYSGRFLGKHKLAPILSPKKTVEGSIGGLLGSILCCGLYGLVLNFFSQNISIIHLIIIGLICGVVCQIGDLSASSIKRSVNIKDYSNFIPGHGGILDRFDSILFASITVYFYITFIMGVK